MPKQGETAPNEAVRFAVHVTSPIHATSDHVVVATHVNAFRGLYYEGAKGVPRVIQDARREAPLSFDVTLPWATRALYPLERSVDAAKEQHSTAAAASDSCATVFLDFMYSTRDATEYRFGTFFSMHDLVTEPIRQLQLKAANNNMRAHNPGLSGRGIPATYNVTVKLLSPTSGAFYERLALSKPIAFADGVTLKQLLSPTGMEQDSLHVAEWIANFLGPLLRQDTPFRNVRTFARLPGFAPLYPHLPSLWQQPGSTFPVTLVLYVTFNSLIMNDISREQIVNDFPLLRGVAGPCLLRVLRDAALALTMCLTEGHYFGDKYYGRDADDQPFVDGMHNDRTVFARDDCEGRLQQGLKVLQALGALHSLSVEDVMALLEEDKRFGLHLFRRLDTDLLRGLIESAIALGTLLECGVVSFHLDVGEACFRSYPKGTPTMSKHLAGHSFGQMNLTPGAPPSENATLEDHVAVQAARKLPPAMHVVEGTGWMDEFVSSACKTATDTYRELFHIAHERGQMTAPLAIRSCTTAEQCDMLYCFVYMQDDHLVFQYDQASNSWKYGASPSAIGKRNVLVVTMGTLLDTFCRSSPAETPSRADDPLKSPVADLIAYVLLSVPASLRRRLHDTCTFANEALARVNAHVAAFTQYAHPPPDRLHEIRKRMAEWAPIDSKSVPTDPSERTLVAFATPHADAAIPVLAGHKAHTYAFMRSALHLIRAAEPGAP